jgi:peptidoglycan/LPS O-acetylase OafA/YrhL
MGTVTAADQRDVVIAHQADARPHTKRLDIQGLRAVAVLLVALNHARVPFLAGGYVGVDVFFVLSGYLITGILLREGFGEGRISLLGFYARRVRRILPAATLTLVVTGIAVYVVYDLARADFLQTRAVLVDALASSLFYANVHFALTATNYFAQAATAMPSPFQHFWSLSVEEQFYFVWAPIVWCLFYVCRRKAPAVAPRVMGVVIGTACALSLVWSVHDTAVDPQAAYFSTLARVWELGLGAMLALLATQMHVLPRSTRESLGWGGLAMIAAAALLYSSQTAFPGCAALLPVVGAGLIIVAGVIPTRAGVDRVLSGRPLAYVGDRSYAFYLWHYPALILAWQAAGRILPVTTNLVLLAGGFMLSAFTYKFFESRLRFARRLRGWRTGAMAAVALAVCLGAVMIPIAMFDGSLAAEAAVTAKTYVRPLAPAPVAQNEAQQPVSLWDAPPIPAVVAAAVQARHNAPLPKQIVPSAQELERENASGGGIVPSDCLPAFGPGATAKVCRLGDVASKHVVVELGDSQAGTWMPALVQIAKKEHFAVVPLLKPGCFVTRVHTNLPGFPCATWYQWALRWDRKLHPEATLIAFLIEPQYLRAIGSTVNAVKSVLLQVANGVYIEDQPSQVQQPDVCLYRPDATMGRCATRVPGGYVPLMKAMASMTAATHHPAIATMQWFCAYGICPMVINHTLTVRDLDHMTRQYSAELTPLFGAELQPLLAAPHGS